MPISTISIYGRSKPIQDRLLFAAACVAEVFPGPKEDRVPKAMIFKMAARYGKGLDECPAYFNTVEELRVYIQNHWKVIRYMLPREHDLVPSYVDGPAWGGGGGYREGDLKHARKQLERDRKISDGVVKAANDYAEAVLEVFPQIEATRTSLVTRRLEKK